MLHSRFYLVPTILKSEPVSWPKEMPCCRCSRTGTCANCSCVKAGKTCGSCLPGKLGKCRNTSARPPPPPPPPAAGPDPTGAHPPASPTSSDPASTSPDALPSLLSIFSTRVPTLQHVPKGARDAWAGVMGDTLASVGRDPSDLVSWRRLFMLPRCILASPARGGRMLWRETLTLVRARLRQWQAGAASELWEEVLAKEQKHRRLRGKPKHSSHETLRRGNARRARRAVGEGQFRKAIQALCSEGLAPVTPEVFEEMLAKHPRAPPPITSPAPAPAPDDISEAEVLRALRSFPSGSAPGPSCCRANHLKEAVLCPSPDRASHALRALSRVVNLLSAGGAPPEVVPHLCGASLIACRKKGGGLRPIAVGRSCGA